MKIRLAMIGLFLSLTAWSAYAAPPPRVTFRDSTRPGAVTAFPATGYSQDYANNAAMQALQLYTDDRAKYQDEEAAATITGVKTFTAEPVLPSAQDLASPNITGTVAGSATYTTPTIAEIRGGAAASDILTLKSTSHATKGKVIFGAAGTTVYDEVNDRVGVGIAAPFEALHVYRSVSPAVLIETATTSGDHVVVQYKRPGQAWDLGMGPGIGDNTFVLYDRTASSVRWKWSTAGHFLAGTDNTYDIGASGATRPRTAYLGTSLVVPTATITTYNASTGKERIQSGNCTLNGGATATCTFTVNYTSATSYNCSYATETNTNSQKVVRTSATVVTVTSAVTLDTGVVMLVCVGT